jgi:hypothetical protein
VRYGHRIEDSAQLVAVLRRFGAVKSNDRGGEPDERLMQQVDQVAARPALGVGPDQFGHGVPQHRLGCAGRTSEFITRRRSTWWGPSRNVMIPPISSWTIGCSWMIFGERSASCTSCQLVSLTASGGK